MQNYNQKLRRTTREAHEARHNIVQTHPDVQPFMHHKNNHHRHVNSMAADHRPVRHHHPIFRYGPLAPTTPLPPPRKPKPKKPSKFVQGMLDFGDELSHSQLEGSQGLFGREEGVPDIPAKIAGHIVKGVAHQIDNIDHQLQEDRNFGQAFLTGLQGGMDIIFATTGIDEYPITGAMVGALWDPVMNAAHETAMGHGTFLDNAGNNIKDTVVGIVNLL